MASTPGQTSGAMLTLLPESQLAFALLPLQPRSLPASKGLQVLINQLPRPWRCGAALASCCSSVDVCFPNELALGTPRECLIPYPEAPASSQPFPCQGKGFSNAGGGRLLSLWQEHPSGVCLMTMMVGTIVTTSRPRTV